MYKLSQVAAAVGVGAPTLLSWFDRQLIPAPRSGTGNHRTFSRDDVIRLALVSELVRLRLPVAEAAKAASAFADKAGTGRAAGELFREGETILVHDAQGTSVLNNRGEGFGVALHFAFGVANTLVNINAVIDRVDAALAPLRNPQHKGNHL